MGIKWETIVNYNGPKHPERETSVGDKCKLMRPKARRAGDKCGRQVGETSVGEKRDTSVNSKGLRHPEGETSVGDKWETSVISYGLRHPEWETRVTSGREV